MPLVYNKRFNADLHMYGAANPSRPNVLFASNAVYKESSWSVTGSSAPSFINLTTTKPPFLRMTASNGYIWANNTDQPFHTARLHAVRFDVVVPSLVNGRVAFFVCNTNVTANQPQTSGIGIRCSTVDGDVNWKGVSKGNGNLSVVDLGIAPSPTNIQRIEWRYYPKERFDCYINGVRVLRHDNVTTLQSTDVNWKLDWHVIDSSAGVNPCILDISTVEVFLDI